jgi:hypothetical protein
MSRKLTRLLTVVIAVKVIGHAASVLAALRLKSSAPPLPDPAADEIDLVVVMAGASLASTAASFRGGRVVCWYGGVELDLRGATVDPAGARLEIRTAFGGTNVTVAPGVPVTVSGPAFFGAHLDETGRRTGDAGHPGIVISGFTVFGGLRIVEAEPGEAIAAAGGGP